jgi:hypothetical protein
MKLSARLTLMGSGLGLILLTAMPSYATVTGTLNIGENGTITVTESSILFNLNDTSGGSAEVAANSTLTYAGSPALATGDPIDINVIGGIATPIVPIGPGDQGPGSYQVDAPVTFPDQPNLLITLTDFGAGSTNTDCSTVTKNGESCSPLTPQGPSPIVLTYLNGETIASLAVNGTATDDGGVTTTSLSGGFSTVIDETPAQLASATSFATDSVVDGKLTLSAATPEPSTISIIGLACLFMGIVVAKRRKSVA